MKVWRRTGPVNSIRCFSLQLPALDRTSSSQVSLDPQFGTLPPANCTATPVALVPLRNLQYISCTPHRTLQQYSVSISLLANLNPSRRKTEGTWQELSVELLL